MPLPFRYRYWLVYDRSLDMLYVMRGRLNPMWRQTTMPLAHLLDGPFDSNEDTVRALEFWSRVLWSDVRIERELDDE